MNIFPLWARPILIGLGLLVLSGLVYWTTPGQVMQKPIDKICATATYHSLGTTGASVVLHGTTIVAPHMRMAISGHRNGLFLLILSALLTISWPCPLKQSALWIAPVMIGAVSLNIVQLSTVFLVGSSLGSSAAGFAEYVIWPILLLALLWILLWRVVHPKTSDIPK